MNIQYLTKLKDNPIEYSEDTDFRFPIKGISEAEITQLEQTWNNGNPFPKVLKELLYLAGEDCYVFDYGIPENQNEMQEWVREQMTEMNKTITRPFYAIDLYGGDQFLFIYLDEGDNPDIYQASAYESNSIWFRNINHTIKSLSERRIDRVKEGYNPF